MAMTVRRSNEPNLFGVPPPPRVKPAAPPADVQRLITVYCAEYELKFGEKAVITKKDGALLKGLAAAFGVETVERRLRAFFALDDDFVRASGYSVGVFKTTWSRLVAIDSKRRPSDAGYQRTQRYLEQLREGKKR